MPYKDKKKQNEATRRWYLKNKEKKAYGYKWSYTPM